MIQVENIKKESDDNEPSSTNSSPILKELLNVVPLQTPKIEAREDDIEVAQPSRINQEPEQSVWADCQGEDPLINDYHSDMTKDPLVTSRRRVKYDKLLPGTDDQDLNQTNISSSIASSSSYLMDTGAAPHNKIRTSSVVYVVTPEDSGDIKKEDSVMEFDIKTETFEEVVTTNEEKVDDKEEPIEEMTDSETLDDTEMVGGENRNQQSNSSIDYSLELNNAFSSTDMAFHCKNNSLGYGANEIFLNNLDNSDIDLSDDDDDEMDTVLESSTSERDMLLESNISGSHTALEEPHASHDTNTGIGKIEWKKTNFIPPYSSWKHVIVKPDIQQRTPMQYFKKYIPDELFIKFAEETNIYSREDSGISVNTSHSEIKTFFGISILMGNLGFPRIRMYWQIATRIRTITDAMPVNRYFKLKTNIHAVARKPDDTSNKFWKIGPIIDCVLKRCHELPHEEFSSVEEQMIPFTGGMPGKQFAKGKLTPEGLKMFVLCGKSGKAHNFILYQGKGTVASERYRAFGSGGSVVLHLTEITPRNENFKVCFDNYFTSIPLVMQLKKLSIFSIGVIKANRLLGCVMKERKELSKTGPGSMDHRVNNDGDVSMVRWYDNNVVQLVSTFVGVGNTDKVKRWCANSKKNINVDRPEVVKVYNELMEGGDKLDFLISLYRINAKIQKWPVRAFFHFMDFSLCNAWLEYKETEKELATPKQRINDLLEFRTAVANALIKGDPDPWRNPADRPLLTSSSTSQRPLQHKKKTTAAQRPVLDVRYDGYHHWPERVKELGQRCKLEGCVGRSRIKCGKCEVFLCLSKDKQCFKLFHVK